MKSISQTQTALGDIAKQLCGIVSETDRENGALAGLNEEVQKLIEELQAQKGSRYAPAVVELFDDPDFCTEFRRKLYESRQSVYLEVYRETI